MAVVGIDLGCLQSVTAQAVRGGVDIILSDSSKRSTPVLVSFVGNERFLGEAATTQVRTNMNNTIAHLKRLIGRKYTEPGIAEELETHVNARVVALPENDIGVEVNYNGSLRTFSATAVLGMYFTKLKENIQRERPGVVSPDVVVSCPAFWSEAQRRALRDAAQMAGLNCLRVINDSTAAALSYGIYKSAKREFPEGKETRVMFLDMGYAHFTATIAGFTNTSLRIVSCVSDASIGGREIDAAIARSLAAEFKTKTGLDAWKNRKARIKLLIAAEKAKIAITPYGVNTSPVSIECLLEDTDLSTKLTIEQLDELFAPQAERIQRVIKAALAQAGIASVAELASVELVGGSMRPRPVKRAAAVALGMALNEETGHGLSTSLNLDECIARGCALACAMLSPIFKVKPYEIQDLIPASVRVSWDAAAAAPPSDDAMELDDDAAGPSTESGTSSSMTLFKAGEAAPITRRITFRRTAAFDVTAEYEADADATLPAGHPRTIGVYRISGIPADAVEAGAAAPRIRVDFRHDINGLFTVVKAELLKEVKEAPAAPAPAPATDGAAPAPADGAAAPSPATPTEAAPAADGADAAKTKKRYKRVELVVQVVPGSNAGMSAEALAAATKAESAMAAQDAEIHATQDMRNTLEAYIFTARDNLIDAWASYCTSIEKDTLQSALSETEMWLGDNYDADKATYAAKLAALKTQGNAIAQRKVEAEGRTDAGNVLLKVIEDFRSVIQNRDGKHGHLSDADRDIMRSACTEAEDWFREKQTEQALLSLASDAVLKIADINARRDALLKELTPIANKPVPPPPAPAPAPAAAAPAPAPAAADANVPPPAPQDGEQKMEES